MSRTVGVSYDSTFLSISSLWLYVEIGLECLDTFFVMMLGGHLKTKSYQQYTTSIGIHNFISAVYALIIIIYL